ncbi:MAG: hypothetical protein EOP48_02190 [Sphingobacteriales bacterium]|nr:MAG: hypothetical protein EOP48_02190 [Sphingobacteriales bacterium]
MQPTYTKYIHLVLRFQDFSWHCLKCSFFTAGDTLDSFEVSSVKIPIKIRAIVDTLRSNEILIYDEGNNNRFMQLVNYLNIYFNFYYPWCKPHTGIG